MPAEHFVKLRKEVFLNDMAHKGDVKPVNLVVAKWCVDNDYGDYCDDKGVKTAAPWEPVVAPAAGTPAPPPPKSDAPVEEPDTDVVDVVKDKDA